MEKRPPRKKREASADYRKVLQLLLWYSRSHAGALITAVILAAACTLCTLFSPPLISGMVKLINDSFRQSMDWNGIRRLAVLLALIYAASTLLGVLQHFLMARATCRITRKMRRDIFDKINRLPMAFFHRTAVGEVLSRVTNDVDVIAQSLNQSVGMLVQAVTLLAGSVVLMSMTNVPMMFTAVVSALVGFSLMKAIMERSQRYFSRQQKYLGATNGYIEEIFTGHMTVKVYGGEETVNAAFGALNEKLRSCGFLAQCWGGIMQPMMNLVGSISYVAVCMVGVMLTMQGSIGFETIVAFMMYVHYFSQPLSQLAQVAQSFQAAAAASQRVFEFLEEEELPQQSETEELPETVQGRVSFDHVTFRYREDAAPAVADFTASAQPGQKIAIVGPTGAGKTTLVNLLLRLYDPQQGRICIDDVPIHRVNRERVRKNIAMVLQDGWIFEASVRENLLFGADVPEEKMVEACRQVKIDGFIRALPQGYDTVLNDTVSLSQGQRQQLTIARALIADKPILILDEATSSVDVKTEYDIQKATDLLMKGRTVFVIAHRLSTVRNADQILVMGQGRILETGTHAELLARDSFYSRLYHSQFAEHSREK